MANLVESKKRTQEAKTIRPFSPLGVRPSRMEKGGFEDHKTFRQNSPPGGPLRPRAYHENPPILEPTETNASSFISRKEQGSFFIVFTVACRKTQNVHNVSNSIKTVDSKTRAIFSRIHIFKSPSFSARNHHDYFNLKNTVFKFKTPLSRISTYSLLVEELFPHSI
jgi:hypothetical protein